MASIQSNHKDLSFGAWRRVHNKQIKLLIEVKNDDLKILILHIKTENTNIIYSMIGREVVSRPKKIDWDDFTREELIKIVKRYKKITDDKKRKIKWKREKNDLDLLVLKLVFLLGISKSGYYKNKNVTYQSKKDMQLVLTITKVFYTNKRSMVEKELQNILNKTIVLRFLIGL